MAILYSYGLSLARIPALTEAMLGMVETTLRFCGDR
jgi:hypothetical protein